MTRCPYCQGGRIAVEPGSSLTYPCPIAGRRIKSRRCCCASTRATATTGTPAMTHVTEKTAKAVSFTEPNDSETKDT